MGWTVPSKELCPSSNPRTREDGLLCWQNQGKIRGWDHFDLGWGSLERMWRRLKKKEAWILAMGNMAETTRKAATSSKAQGAAGTWQCQEILIPRASQSRGAPIIPTQTADVRMMSKNIPVVLKWSGLQWPEKAAIRNGTARESTPERLNFKICKMGMSVFRLISLH